MREVVATTSLNRPGASDYIDNFVKRKHGLEQVELIDDSLADILARLTVSCSTKSRSCRWPSALVALVWESRDILRRAMEKSAAEMHRMREDFVAGAFARSLKPAAKSCYYGEV